MRLLALSARSQPGIEHLVTLIGERLGLLVENVLKLFFIARDAGRPLILVLFVVGDFGGSRWPQIFTLWFRVIDGWRFHD